MPVAGIEYHISLKPRIDELELETAAFAKWFHRGQQTPARLNAEMNMLSSLVSILRDWNKFDEEQLCLRKVRNLHNTLWMRRNPINFVMWPLLRYLELLLSSFAMFLAVLGVWIVVLSLLYWWASDTAYKDWTPGLPMPFHRSFPWASP